MRVAVAMRLLPDDAWAIATIWGEARGESQLGKVAVAEVIRNRMVRRLCSDGTVAGTVLWPFQFSAWNTSDPNRRRMATLDTEDPILLDCRAAWEESEHTIATLGATHYLNPSVLSRLPAWAADPDDPTRLHEAAVTLREGRHVFLKLT